MKNKYNKYVIGIISKPDMGLYILDELINCHNHDIEGLLKELDNKDYIIEKVLCGCDNAVEFYDKITNYLKLPYANDYNLRESRRNK